MKQTLSLLLIGAALLSAFGCKPASSVSVDEAPETESLVQTTDQKFTTALTQTNWCVVESDGLPYDRQSAVALTYLKEGYALIKSIRSSGPSASIVEEGAAAMWTYEGEQLSFRNLLTEEVSHVKATWIDYKPTTIEGSLWGFGVSSSDQTCLKTESIEGDGHTEVHCPCDLHKIWEQEEMKN